MSLSLSPSPSFSTTTVCEHGRHLPDGGQCHSDASDGGALLPLPVPPSVAIKSGPIALAGAAYRRCHERLVNLPQLLMFFDRTDMPPNANTSFPSIFELGTFSFSFALPALHFTLLFTSVPFFSLPHFRLCFKGLQEYAPHSDIFC